MFNPDIIGELRKRVAAHNEIVKATHPDMVVKLGGVKKLYKRWYSGPDPHAHALAMLDARLLTQQTMALGELEKARQPFEGARHPRGRGGQFRSSGRGGGGTGGGGGGGTVAPRPAGGGPGDGDNALLQAAQTQVIPETRYTVFGPKVAAAAGIGLGAIAGATARPGLPWQGGGSVIDRGVTSIAGALGRQGGKLVGIMGRAAGIDAPIGVARRVVPILNRHGGAFPMPGPTAGVAAGDRLVNAAGRGGRAVGRGISHAFSLANYPAARVGQMVARTKGPIAGRAAAAMVGAALPGIAYARTLHHVQGTIGPYQDTLFPRRVKKIDEQVRDMVGPIWDDPAVLAKQAELLTLPDLAKQDLSEFLTKVSFGPAVSAGGAAAMRSLRFLRGPVARATRMFTKPPPPPPPMQGPPSAIQHAAETAFGEQAGHFRVPRNVGVRAGVIAGHVAGLGLLGAGAGALTGAGLAAFAIQHPRDPHTGKFRSKGQAARTGALHGAVLGSGLGLALGIVAARGGQKELLRAALGRLRDQVATKEGAMARAAMHDRAEKSATDTFSATYMADNPHLKIEVPDGSRVKPSQIRKHQGDIAVEDWVAREGAAMHAGPVTWYQKQVEDHFEAFVDRQLLALKSKRQRNLPRRNDADRLIDSVDDQIVTTHNELGEAIHHDPLTVDQRRIWNGALEMRQRARDEIEAVYAGRRAQVKEHGTAAIGLKHEQGQLIAKLGSVRADWNHVLLTKPSPSVEQLRAVATSIGHKLEAKTKEGIVAELQERIPRWEHEVDSRITQIKDEIPQLEDAAEVARASEKEDLTQEEQRLIRNPFIKTRKARKGKPAITGFFEPRLPGVGTAAGYDEIKAGIADEANKAFNQGLERHVIAAKQHLEELALAEEAAIQARIPANNVFAEWIKRKTPEFSDKMAQGWADYNELTAAYRGQLKGQMKQLYDGVHAHRDPKKAFDTIKKMAKGAADFWNSDAGKWLRQNWKYVVGVVGPMAAIGIIDLQAGPGKKKVELNPKKWRWRNVQAHFELPGGLKRPDEAVFGVKFKDKDGKEKFLHAIHVKNKEGEYQNIGYGSEVNSVSNFLRGGDQQGGGGHGGNRPNKAQVNNGAEVDKAIADGIAAGHINEVGPTSFTYAQRKMGEPQGKKEEESVRKWFVEKHINGLQHIGNQHFSSDKHDRFYASLRDLFEGGRTELFDRDTRKQLLLGSDFDKRNRGIFGNQKVWHDIPHDPAAVGGALLRQLKMAGAMPLNPEEYTQMHRALSFVANLAGLDQNQKSSLNKALQDGYLNITKRTSVPTVSASGLENQKSIESFKTEMLNNDKITEARQRKGLDDQGAFTDLLDTLYQKGREGAVARNNSADDNEQHVAGMQHVREQVFFRLNTLGKAAPLGDLYKLFGMADRFDEQRHPRGHIGQFRAAGHNAPPQVGAISGARQHMPTPDSPGPQSVGDFAMRRPPESPGMAPTQAPAGHGGRFGGADFGASHMLGQVGTYGLSQAGWDVVGNLASHMMPAGGMVSNATKFGLQTMGGFAGSIGGLKGGQALGHAMGDRSPHHEAPAAEGIVRNLAGGGAQIAFNEYAGPAVGRVIAGAAGRALGGTAGSFLGPAGTILGSALVGALTDEGVGILYRHLSRYGEHVPEHAIKHFRHKGAPA